MHLPPLILLLLGVWAAGVAPARAGDAQPPAAIARDLEMLNRMLQQRKASSSTPARPPVAPPPSAAPAPTPAPVQPPRVTESAPGADDAAIAQLIAALADDAKEARAQARQKLVKIGAPAVPELIEALDDTELRVRIEAAEALASLKDPRAAEALAGLLGDPARQLWPSVYRALREIGPPAVPALLDALDKHDSNARWKAVNLLGAIQTPGAAEALVELLNKDRSTGVRVEIAAALGKIKDRTACDALLDALHDW